MSKSSQFLKKLKVTRFETIIFHKNCKNEFNEKCEEKNLQIIQIM